MIGPVRLSSFDEAKAFFANTSSMAEAPELLQLHGLLKRKALKNQQERNAMMSEQYRSEAHLLWGESCSMFSEVVRQNLSGRNKRILPDQAVRRLAVEPLHSYGGLVSQREIDAFLRDKRGCSRAALISLERLLTQRRIERQNNTKHVH